MATSTGSLFLPASDMPTPQSVTVVNDARKSRKAVFRRTIDYNASVMQYLKDRIWIHRSRDKRSLEPDYLWSPKLYPPKSYLDCPMNCVMSKPVRTSTNKNKCPIYCVCWTPEGRRLITGAFSGEFTLWNGLTFNFETILQAHESQIRCMKWSHNDEWLLTADHSGYVKYWQANMNNVEMYQAHKEPIRGVSFCPFDTKFVTCSDDSTVRIWDFNRCAEERVLRGHGSDVRSVAWHPTLSLIISGSKDAQQPIKLWDPKTGESVTTLYIHKNTCTDVAWNDNGNWFLTASRDHLIKLFDLRCLKSELQTFRGHKRDVMRVAWHPFHECLFASGSADGSIFYWLAGTDTELGAVENAHESMIWSLAWHPLGHILVSGANDFATKFWTRNRPGDILKESATGGTSEGLIHSTGQTVVDADSLDHLSLANDLLKSLAESALPNKAIDVNEETAFISNPEDLGTSEIPGLNEGFVADLNLPETADDSDDRAGNKLRSTRTIPKEFAANWASTRITSMPTVMMIPATPNPTQLVSAVAAAAAVAVSDFSSAPQYLPPVKPAPVNKDRAPQPTIDDTVRNKSKHPPDHIEGVCTRSVRPMNYLGQPPEMPDSMLPREPDRMSPVGPPADRRVPSAKWPDGADIPCLPNLNNGGPPPPHVPVRCDERETFSQPPFQPPCPEFPRHVEDRDYREFDRPDHGPPPSGPPPHHFNRQVHGPNQFAPPSHPPPEFHGPPHRHDQLPPERSRNFAPDIDSPHYEERHNRFPPVGEPPRPFLGPREPFFPERGWPVEGPHRFPDYSAHVPRRPPPGNRFPPPPREPFHPEPNANFYPPGKRMMPPPNVVPPEHRQKFPRDDHWGGQNQW